MMDTKTLWLSAMLFLGTPLMAEDAVPPPPPPKQPEVREVKIEEKREEKVVVRNSKGDGWDRFTNFWVHDVGDTIGDGLKTGTRKIKHAFNGGSKERDEADKRSERIVIEEKK